MIEGFADAAQELDQELLTTLEVVGAQLGQLIERRRAEESGVAVERRHRATLEAAIDCVITMDHNGGVVEFNPAAERTFGYTSEEAVGQEMATLIVPEELRDQPPPRPAAVSRKRRADPPRPPDRDRGDTPRRDQVPGRADDHPDRRPRRGRLHRPPSRHHRPAPGRTRAARVADAARRGRRRGAAPDRARPPRRRPAAADQRRDDPRGRGRARSTRTPPQPASCWPRRRPNCARRRSSCASSPAASTRRC